MAIGPENVAGVVLAGGLSRRMGGEDKSLKTLGGRPIIDYVVERARPQVATLLINANGDAKRFAHFGLPVAADVVEGFAGPLAGVLTGMEWAAENAPGAEWLVSFATDAPFVPEDLVARLIAAVEAEGAEMACAKSSGRAHPVFGLWPVGLAGALKQAMVADDMRKIDRWTERFRLVEVDFAAEPFDPFFNINDPASLAEAEALLQRRKGAA